MKVYGFLDYFASVGVKRYGMELAKRSATKLFLCNAPFNKKMGNTIFMKYLPLPTLKRTLSTLLYYPLKYKFMELDADIYHAYYDFIGYPLIMARKKPLVISYHNVGGFPSIRQTSFSSFTSIMSQLLDLSLDTFSLWFSPILRKEVDLIIANSNATKKSLIRNLALPPEKIKVIYLGVDEEFGVIGDKAKIKEELGIKSPFIFAIWTISRPEYPRPWSVIGQDRINITVRMFYKLKRKFKDLKLYVAGLKGDVSPALLNLIVKLNLQKDVIFLGYVPDDDLIRYYNAADVFVYPALYEWFGLPPLEAMSCGTPVVVSNRFSLPEVVGDGGMLVQHSVNEFVKAVEMLLTDELLWHDLRERGLARSKEFTWDKTAELTQSVYKEVLEK